MKSIFVLAAFVIGFSLSANAQSTSQGKQTAKTVVNKSTKKETVTKSAAVMKSTSTNTANAPVFLSMPRLDADTTGLPIVRREEE